MNLTIKNKKNKVKITKKIQKKIYSKGKRELVKTSSNEISEGEQNNNNNTNNLENYNKLKSKLKYIYVEKNDKQFRYSMDKCVISNKNKNITIYYVCYDSKCKPRCNIKFKIEDLTILNILNNYENLFNFILTQKHNIEYHLHSYKRDIYIKNELYNITTTKDKLKNFTYLKAFIKEFCINNKSLNKAEIKNKLYDYYPNLEIELTDLENKNIYKNIKKKKISIQMKLKI